MKSPKSDLLGSTHFKSTRLRASEIRDSWAPVKAPEGTDTKVTSAKGHSCVWRHQTCFFRKINAPDEYEERESSVNQNTLFPSAD